MKFPKIFIQNALKYTLTVFRFMEKISLVKLTLQVLYYFLISHSFEYLHSVVAYSSAGVVVQKNEHTSGFDVKTQITYSSLKLIWVSRCAGVWN